MMMMLMTPVLKRQCLVDICADAVAGVIVVDHAVTDGLLWLSGEHDYVYHGGNYINC